MLDAQDRRWRARLKSKPVLLRSENDMALSKADIRIIYIALKVLETALPYEDEVEEILEKCREALPPEMVDDLDAEVEDYFTDGTLESLRERIQT
jgi:hypothetical protein